ncbi:MAG: 3-dehydroquinate synthase [Pseudomonadota bacterium]
MTLQINVDLAERSYPIHIGSGLLASTGQIIADMRPGARVVIVSDRNVDAQHGDALRNSLSKAGISHDTICVDAGEPSKSYPTLVSVTDKMLDLKLERNDLLIAFGGGVVGDLAGFAAAIFRRGIDFVQIPTSLLAQVDSSVGGKTGINTSHGKNLIGAFHQPILVLADTDLLKTLPEREFRAGYAEVVKYGLIDDPDFFDWLDENAEEVFNFGPALARAIAVSCESKARIVSEDEREQGKRALLNLGHTFGHALEAAVEYDSSRLVHGEAVAIGIMMAHEFSNRLNICDADSVERVRSHLLARRLPTRISDIEGSLPDAKTLRAIITQDKKVSQGKLTFILTKGLGQSYIADDVPGDAVESFLGDKLSS